VRTNRIQRPLGLRRLARSGNWRRFKTQTAVSVMWLALSIAPAHASSGQSFLVKHDAVKPPSGATHLCQSLPWACTSGVGTVSAGDLAQIGRVNRQINGQVRNISDLRQFNQHEYWALPTHRGGDCEDIALLKKQTLLQMGFPPQALLIATVLDRQRFGHAVLVVRTDQGDMVLDNQTNRILPWAKTGYVFLRMQDPSAPQHWVSLI